MKPHIGFVTVTVSNLKRAKSFYENLIGLEPDVYYEPTRWQAYAAREKHAQFAIIESSNHMPPDQNRVVTFYLDDIEELYGKIKNVVQVIEPIEMTPWGSYRFQIVDPDGNVLCFVQFDKVRRGNDHQ